MSSGNIGYTEGWASPASIKAELGHKYRWLKTGAVYKQVGTGVSNNWVEDKGCDTCVDVLNDITNVDTKPNVGAVLAWDDVKKLWLARDVTLIGRTIFVSERGGLDVRESISAHFNDLSKAVIAAQQGDLVIVYPGDYSTGDIWKRDVSYYFMPGANVEFTGSLFTAASNEECYVYGKGNFTQKSISGSPAFSFEQVGAKGRFEANNITVEGNTGFQLTFGELHIVANEIRMRYRQYLLYFRLTEGIFHIKANKIINENASGLTIARTIYLRALSATSDVKIDCPYIGLEGTGTNSQLVYYINEPSAGTVVINGNFYDNRALTDGLSGVWLGTNAKITGDIYAVGDTTALMINGNQTKDISFTGNIYQPNGDVVAPVNVSGNDGILRFKGDIYTTSEKSAYFTGTSITYFNGNIYNQHAAGIIVTGIQVDTTHDFIVEFAKVYFGLAPHAAGSYCITGSNNDVRIYTNLLSNVAADPATNNLITGTNIIIDTDIL